MNIWQFRKRTYLLTSQYKFDFFYKDMVVMNPTIRKKVLCFNFTSQNICLLDDNSSNNFY